METFHRLVVPAFVVILLTATVILSLISRPENMSFDDLLGELKTTQNPQAVLEPIRRQLAFQESGLKPEAGTAEAQTVANLYYNTGNALKERQEEAFRETAFEFYEKSVQLFPAVSHGWPYFLMAEIRQSQDRLPEAQELYSKVILYDYSDLSLKAGYWIELLKHWQGKPVDPRPVYAYYRYGDMGQPVSLRPFAKAVFKNEPEALFTQALALRQSQPPEPFEELLEKYRRLRPNDYSARNFPGSIFPLLPEDGRLQEQVYTLNAFHNGHLRLLSNGQLRVDFYTSHRFTEEITIQFELDNPFGLAGRIQAYLNRKALPVLSFQNSNHLLSVRVKPDTDRNLLTLHFLPLTDSDRSNDTSWVQIDDLHIVLPETAP